MKGAQVKSTYVTRKRRRRLLRVGILLGMLGLGFIVAGCTALMPQASFEMMNDAEAQWEADPIAGYRIVVDVERPSDRRRTEVTVRQDAIVRADVQYWNDTTGTWDEPSDLNQEQAYPFTVPGLFDMVRGELASSGRADVRVSMDGSPAFPHRIVLGPVWLDGKPVSGTEATVVVRTFEPVSE